MFSKLFVSKGKMRWHLGICALLFAQITVHAEEADCSSKIKAYGNETLDGKLHRKIRLNLKLNEWIPFFFSIALGVELITPSKGLDVLKNRIGFSDGPDVGQSSRIKPNVSFKRKYTPPKSYFGFVKMSFHLWFSEEGLHSKWQIIKYRCRWYCQSHCTFV